MGKAVSVVVVVVVVRICGSVGGGGAAQGTTSEPRAFVVQFASTLRPPSCVSLAPRLSKVLLECHLA